MQKELIKDIIEWDLINWSKGLKFWEKNVDIKDKNYTCLELGGRRGGLSLWLAVNNNQVVCTDVNNPEKDASDLHEKYNCSDKITYESLNAIDIGYENHFDVVAFKSIMGAISVKGKDHLKKHTLDEIHKSLKDKGVLLFAENLEASSFHKYFRTKFVRWGYKWNYMKYDEIDDIFSSYSKVKFVTIGFFGVFGRSEKQRQWLGRLDHLLEIFIPRSKRYIIYGIAWK